MNSYTYRIRIIDREHVQVEVRDADQELLGEMPGEFGLAHDAVANIKRLNQAAQAGNLAGSDVEVLGEALFNIVFDAGLRRDFFGYLKLARQQGMLVRVELDVDEARLPDVAALPWEFLRVPPGSGYKTAWLATDPALVFSRRRTLWTAPEPIELQPREHLRIAVAVAAPDDDELGSVEYELLIEKLTRLAQMERIELLKPVLSATRHSIDDILRQKPHIFHFIGHGRIEDGSRGQIALEKVAHLVDWVDADDFGDLLNRHQPGVVVLQACESGRLSDSEAFVGIAAHIVRQNIPVVVAMQFQVSNLTATDFALEFYQRLTEGDPADRAVQEGRRRIALGPYGYNRRDFATPVLFMRVRDGHLFQRQPGLLTEEQARHLQTEAVKLAADGKIDDALKLWKDIRDYGQDRDMAYAHIEELQQRKVGFLKQEARKLEQNEAYDDALQCWQDIAAMDGDREEAGREMTRLRQHAQNRASLQEIQQQLLRRMSEIKGIYIGVARRLKRMQKEGIDDEADILLEVVGQFLSNNLSAAEFAEMWQEAVQHAAPKVVEPNYDALAQRLRRGEIIPVIGPDVHHLTGLPLPLLPELVQNLAQHARYEGFSGPLSMISQYYEMTEYGRSTLLQNVQTVVEPQTLEGQHPLYRLLASIEAPLLVVSVCYDRLLEQYFREQKRQFVVISHVKIDQQLSKVVLNYSDQPGVETYNIAESLSPLKLLEDGYSILYKVCGCFGMSPAETHGAMDSVVISEEDYFAFAKQVERIIPGYVATNISRRSLLFLGNSLNDWQDRLILNAVLEKNRTNRARSYVVQEEPSTYEHAYWKFHGVDVYQMNLKTFVKRLGDYV